MSDLYQKLETCLASVRKKTDFKPEVALILGSGLGDYADEIQIETTIDYTEIEGFPTSTVAGHKGRFVFGYVKNVPVVIMQGRVPDSYTHLDVYKRQVSYPGCKGGSWPLCDHAGRPEKVCENRPVF